MKKDHEILPAFSGSADPVVAEILGEAGRRQEELRLSPEERKRLVEARRKAEHRQQAARQKAEAQKPNRTLTYLPVALREQLEGIAREHGVSVSQVISFFLYEALARYEQREISFWGHKYPTTSPRYDWNLIHPQDDERMHKVKSEKKRKSGWGTR